MLVGWLGFATPALACDRPDPVRVVAERYVALHADLSVTGAARVSCAPGWSGGELSVQVNQGSSYTSGFVVAHVRCDGRWHRVTFTLVGPPFGTLHRGAVTISSQFLVTNDETGDSAGGHDVLRPGHLVRRA